MAASLRTVRGNTIVVAEEIGEEHYGFRPTPESRTVAQTLAHIALSPRIAERIHFIEKLHSFEGFDFFKLFGELKAEEQAPRTKAEILDLLRESGEKLAQQLESCSEEFLGERVSSPPRVMPPVVKSRFEMLSSVKEHEMHHRGQLMLVQRLLGLTPHLTRQMQAMAASMQAAKAQP